MKIYKKLVVSGILAAGIAGGAVMFTPDNMKAETNVVLASVDWVKQQLAPINNSVSSLTTRVAALESKVATQQTEINNLKTQVSKLTTTTTTTAQPALPSIVYVNKSSVTIHSGALRTYRIVATKPYGTALSVVDKFTSTSGLWYRVKVSSTIFGWVYSGDISTAKPTTTITQKMVVAKSEANVRRGADTSYAIVGTLPGGSSAKYISSFKNSKGETWYNIELSSGVRGWVISTLCEVR